jgi:endonuclease/exonuclease/phosphatase family metal-dependent hydrolase
LLLNLQFVLI